MTQEVRHISIRDSYTKVHGSSITMKTELLIKLILNFLFLALISLYNRTPKNFTLKYKNKWEKVIWKQKMREHFRASEECFLNCYALECISANLLVLLLV